MLLSLLSVKMPITDADTIRALACKALVGLSRSSSVRQIISKLPLFTCGQIQQVRLNYLRHVQDDIRVTNREKWIEI